MMGIGHWELVIILLVVLLVFGSRRIPDAAQGLGKGIREFRKAMRDVQDEIDINAPASSPVRSQAGSAPPPQAAIPTQSTAPTMPVLQTAAGPAAYESAAPQQHVPPKHHRRHQRPSRPDSGSSGSSPSAQA